MKPFTFLLKLSMYDEWRKCKVLSKDSLNKMIYYEFMGRRYTHEPQEMTYLFWQSFSYKGRDGNWMVKEGEIHDFKWEWLAQ